MDSMTVQPVGGVTDDCRAVVTRHEISRCPEAGAPAGDACVENVRVIDVEPD